MAEIVSPLEMQNYHTKVEDAITRKISAKQGISFSGIWKNCCVGFVDVVNSTKITANLKNDKMCEYYGIFLNAMTAIAEEFDAVIVKNIGDSLLYYFPKTEDAQDKNLFKKAMECTLAMIESHNTINTVVYECGLPPVDYRVSSDYGRIAIAKSSGSDVEDLFGPTVNVCAKMNTIALPNNIVIGGDLHQVVKSFKEYSFGAIAGYSLGLKLEYPIYSMYRNKNWF